MVFKEMLPEPRLQPYIKCFYLYESDSDRSYDDIVFPSGTMEVIFNLGAGNWKSKKGDTFFTTPPVELWGQITKPLPIQSVGRNIMLGFRFYPHSAAYFFDENVSEFNNEIVDATHVFGPKLRTLYLKLLETADLNAKVAMIEDYLRSRLSATEKKHSKIKFIGDIVSSLKKNYSDDNILSISSRYNISSRHLNTLFSQYTGLPPKLFYKINRFQHSLNLVSANEEKLTNVAYSAGYFDQAHFIKEFKLFTGFTPNSFAAQASPINQALAGS
ncbi:AraC-like DNA-binding protein [Mucilaginibacter rubeus]|uniref:AraC family transcriptional regulator n=1 Tax=Mucilaginibacter rubeus TaxID=2027860 RepID=A0AAE6MJ39_9SPHI|nr:MULTISPECIES: AraC family transcriptional regulator [Mucilaginibacter]QEM05253.1 AraC family transcriptional regulator [Mucilaginibacter rubeus]QEM17845.1 AraC family transcriptional regulator [Mucilaginibacter gossypii]QTE45624.1 AraC family transcriptional regulator [Mucilaginibacter rubeus]QTE52221.1 AraC family transcriptional regulator [Mucilaginibacter rubeus]QTE57309.1 AraC family transcriptional regulator [Mucilaginibacter rubeus]